MLIGQSSIFTTGVQKILEQVDEIEIVGVVPLAIEREVDLVVQIERLSPDVVVLAGEDDDPAAVETLLARLLKAHPDLTVIVTNLAENVLHIYTSQLRVARGPDLIAAICNLPDS